MDVEVNEGSILNLDLGSWLIQWCLLVLSLLSGTASPSSTSGPLPGPCLLSPGTGPPSLSLLPPQLSPSHLGHLCSRYGSCPQSPVRTLADGNKFLLHLSLKLATFCHVTNYPQIWWLKTTFLTTSCSIGQAPGCGLAESSASEYHRLQSVGWGCCPH